MWKTNIDAFGWGKVTRSKASRMPTRRPVLPKGVQLKHAGVTQRDIDFGKLTDQTRNRILAGLRVSKTILGTAESDTTRD
jgi:hypothetical protein